MANEMKFEYRLLDVLETDHVQYKALHNQLFPGAATSSEWIHWYHGQIGGLKKWSTDTRTWGVFFEKELIGIWSVEPKLVQNKGLQLKVGRCFAVGIHAEYRRHGIFVALSEFAIAQEKLLKEYEYILGFPQMGRSVIGGHYKAGWEEVQSIDIYSRRNASKVFGLSRNSAKSLGSFSEVLDGSQHNGIIENSAYRNLRWGNHPDHHYICYAKNNAAIVLKTYSNFCHILEMIGDPLEVKDLLAVVQSLSIKHGWIETNVWCADNEVYKDTLLAAGYESGAEFGLPITMIAVRINATEPLEFDTCSLQMGVEEGY